MQQQYIAYLVVFVVILVIFGRRFIKEDYSNRLPFSGKISNAFIDIY